MINDKRGGNFSRLLFCAGDSTQHPKMHHFLKFQDRVKKRKSGRPKFARQGVKVVAVSVGRDLLARAELFTEAILKLFPKVG
jgi:hypothetical protein